MFKSKVKELVPEVVSLFIKKLRLWKYYFFSSV